MSVLKKSAFILSVAFAALSAGAGEANGLYDPFQSLFQIASYDGQCLIKTAGSDTFKPVITDKAYPYGSTLQCGLNSKMVFRVSPSEAIRITAGTEVNLVSEGGMHIVELKNGTLETRFTLSETNNSVIVKTPAALCTSFFGNGRISYQTQDNAGAMEVRAERGGTMKILGSQFVIPLVKSATAIRITSTKGDDYSIIRSISGNTKVMINKSEELDPQVAEDADYSPLLPIDLTPNSTIKIWREKAKYSNRLVVSAIAVGAGGKNQKTYSFVVGKDEIGTSATFADSSAPATETATDTAEDGTSSGESNATSEGDFFEEGSTSEESDSTSSSDDDFFF